MKKGLSRILSEQSRRMFTATDVSGCDDVNCIMEELNIGKYVKENIDYVCKGYSRIFDDKGDPIAIVNNSYDLLQPIEAFAFADALKEGLGFKYTRAGFTHGGRRMFIEANCGTFEVKSKAGPAKVGDVIEKRIIFGTSFDGTTATYPALQGKRYICSNGMSRWFDTDVRAIRHTRNQRQIIASAVEQITGIKQAFIGMNEDAHLLASTPCKDKDMIRIVERHLKIDDKSEEEISTRTQGIKDTIMSEFSNEDRGTYGVSAWDALNAFTAYQTHHKSYRETAETTREENRFRHLQETNPVKRFRNQIHSVLGV